MKKRKGFFRERIKLEAVETVEMASEEAVKRLGGTIGWGSCRCSHTWPYRSAGRPASGRQRQRRYICLQTEGWEKVPCHRAVWDVYRVAERHISIWI